jgi:G:T/U-mismatch repair DNA glycosylase
MSKSPLRKDKTCLNCKFVVENRFCPNCGQENTDTRKTFYHLFVHFFEDLTHYENAFWKTIKNLLFKPAALTKEYLSGKRLSYLAPIRLYIFVSFVTFFLISLLPSDIEEVIKEDKTKTETKSSAGGLTKIKEENKIGTNNITASPQELKLKILLKEGKLSIKEYDTLVDYTKKSKEKQNTFDFGNNTYKSIKELDSVQKFGKKKLSPISYWLTKKLMKAVQNKSSDEIIPLFFESLKHNIPKALFFYMPLFAFLLWLFYDKKKWYYFDHGIFTLHYFSFMLLIILISTFLLRFIYLFGENSFTESIDNLVNILVFLWFIFYFYRACKNFYQSSRAISFIKSSLLLFLNTILLFFVLLFLILYSFITIH